MKQYLELVQDVLENGLKKEDRTGVGTISVFGTQKKYDLREGFPLVTTKKVKFENILHELLWFLSGETHIRYLVQNGVNIWNEWAYQFYLEENDLVERYPRYSEEWKAQMKVFVQQIIEDESFAKKWADLGPVYGKQWRAWGGLGGKTYDQIQYCLDQLRNNPTSRRILVNGWNVAELQELIHNKHHAPPPCHTLFQFNVMGDRLDLQLYQRSADVALGVPYNIASYALLLTMFAQEVGLIPGVFVHTIGDCHIYSNHLDGMKEQLTRKPHELPTLKVNQRPFWNLRFKDFELSDYKHDPFIRFPIAV